MDLQLVFAAVKKDHKNVRDKEYVGIISIRITTKLVMDVHYHFDKHFLAAQQAIFYKNEPTHNTCSVKTVVSVSDEQRPLFCFYSARA